MVIAMIPTLASYSISTFKEQVLHKAIGHLLSKLGKPDERDYGASGFPFFHLCTTLIAYCSDRPATVRGVGFQFHLLTSIVPCISLVISSKVLKRIFVER
ncbi:hypothetical protein FB451DRAFT_1269378 [Mycena latifolia]|nr:hypothetical protein FB451DRAFT_1269378 [Mycena latifolia]